MNSSNKSGLTRTSLDMVEELMDIINNNNLENMIITISSNSTMDKTITIMISSTNSNHSSKMIYKWTILNKIKISSTNLLMKLIKCSISNTINLSINMVTSLYHNPLSLQIKIPTIPKSKKRDPTLTLNVWHHNLL